jgi:hypothetical protein
MDDDSSPIPTITLKIKDGVELPDIDTGVTVSVDQLVAQSGAAEGPELAAIRAVAPDLVLGWAFVSLSMADINSVIDRAVTEDPHYVAPQFDHFFEIVCPEGVDAPALAQALDAWKDVVEYAYVVGIAAQSSVVASGNTFYSLSMQDYLAAAPDGVDAPAAWAKGADGGGFSFIDVEGGWFLGHEDLPQTIQLLAGRNRTSGFDHGAAVLGIVVAADNQIGIVGLAPGAAAQLQSIYDDLTTSTIPVQRLADRIAKAAKVLTYGNVILLPITWSDTTPIETDPLVFASIRLATKAGVIIVEASGNSGVDLDAFVMDKGPLKGQRTLSRSNIGEFADSGAILVGSALSAPPHGRASLSNYGSRIDCYAWGENIVTSGWDPADPTASNHYWGVDLTDSAGKIAFFGGTSGASAIIAGCCLLVQSLRGILTPLSGSGILGPLSMRRCLSTLGNGTASSQASDLIGVMPDLAKIIVNEFQP